jgi:peptidyl-prolyl cis-trans isomerase C
MKSIAAHLATALVCLCLVSSPQGASAQETPAGETPSPEASGNVAVVNGTAITQADFEREFQAAMERLSRSGQPVSGIQGMMLRQQVVESLVNEELLVQESATQKIVVPEERVTADFEAIKSRFPSEAEFKTALENRGIGEAELQEKLRRRLAIQELMEKELPEDFETTESERKQFYEENPDIFHKAETVRASHILIELEPEADEKATAEANQKMETVRKAVADGGDFGELAKTHSEGPSGPNGGDLGYFSRGQMVKPFEDAAFALKVGETSDVVRTDFGLHLIRVTDRKSEETVSFEDAEADITQMLVERKRRAAFEAYMDGLREKADIEMPTG